MSSIDTATDGLLTAGRFGSVTLLSAKALRIYAERGLLPPYRVDPDNGYRYYHPDQVQTGWLIALLRSADLPLDEISEIVHGDVDTALGLIERSEGSLDAQTAARKSVLERVRHHLRKDTAMPDVTTVLVPDRPVLSLLRRLHVSEIDTVINNSLATLRQAAEQTGLEQTEDPFGIFHAPVDGDSDGPLEIVLPVDELTDLTGDIRSYRLPGGLVANRLAVGKETDFPEILGLYDEVHSWIAQAGHTPVGPPREIWHNEPGGNEPLRLTISWPYAA
jgi:DNA-binding transcriptional MerR regulator